jgi:hypothetical protein
MNPNPVFLSVVVFLGASGVVVTDEPQKELFINLLAHASSRVTGKLW